MVRQKRTVSPRRTTPTQDLKARQRAATDGDDIDRAEAEIAFSAAFLNYASDLKIGRLSPRKVDPELFVENKTFDGSTALGDLHTQDDLDIYFRLFAPKNPEYRALRVLLSNYRKIAANGGWPKVAKGETLKPEMRDPRVAQVRTRLKSDGRHHRRQRRPRAVRSRSGDGRQTLPGTPRPGRRRRRRQKNHRRDERHGG